MVTLGLQVVRSPADINTAMNAAGWTLGRRAELARRVGCSRSYLSLLTTTAGRAVSADLASAIARELGVPMGDLFMPKTSNLSTACPSCGLVVAS